MVRGMNESMSRDAFTKLVLTELFLVGLASQGAVMVNLIGFTD